MVADTVSQFDVAAVRAVPKSGSELQLGAVDCWKYMAMSLFRLVGTRGFGLPR